MLLSDWGEISRHLCHLLLSPVFLFLAVAKFIAKFPLSLSLSLSLTHSF